VQLGPAVEVLLRDEEGILVGFKRYLAPLLLSGDETGILELVVDGSTIEDILGRCQEASPSRVLGALRRLERDRVITIGLPHVPDWLDAAVPA
jgi:hypothetical protein